MGPEAPLVQTTGTIGTWWGTRRGRPLPDVRILTITGMAAGFTVLFGAPLGSALFALEILHRRGLQYYEALIPAVTGSLCGYAVYVGLSSLDIQPVWNFPPVGTLHPADLLTAVGIGVVGAVGAAIFGATTHIARRAFGLVPRSGRYVLGGLALGLLGLWSPYALTFGEAQLAGILNVRLAAGALAVAVVAKLLGTTITLAAGWKGGFIIPLFFMGAAFGQLAHIALTGSNESVLMAGLMVALLRRGHQDPARHHSRRHRDGRAPPAAGHPHRRGRRAPAHQSVHGHRDAAVPSEPREHRPVTGPPLSLSEYRSLARFRHALRVFQRFSEDAARAAGITPAQHQLLLAVKGWDGEGSPTITDIAELLQLKHHSTVELVQRANVAGLVEASIDAADGRRHLTDLTDLGETILASLSLQHRDELRRFRNEMNDVLRELG